MAKHVWSILCRRGIIDQISQVVSLHDVLENVDLHGDTPPFKEGEKPKHLIPVEMMMVSFWLRDETKSAEHPRQRVRMITPAGETAMEGIVQFDLAKFEQARNLINFPGLPFAGFGKYWARVDLETDNGGWSEVAAIPFTVRKAPDVPAVSER